jgi:IS605 OrfB family transposase
MMGNCHVRFLGEENTVTYFSLPDRERTNEQRRTKTERRRSNSWAFFQLRQFLTYKAIKFGVKLVLIDPRYTSQTCHNCLHIHPVRGQSYRSGKSFRCGHCGWFGDADLNGAKNISTIGAFVNMPRGSGLFCSLDRDDSGLLKASTERVAGRGSLHSATGLQRQALVANSRSLLVVYLMFTFAL